MLNDGMLVMVGSAGVMICVGMFGPRSVRSTPFVVAALLMLIAYGTTLAIDGAIGRGNGIVVPVLTGLSVLAAVSALMTAFWGMLQSARRSPVAPADEMRNAWTNWPPTTWAGRVVIATLSAILGSTALLIDGVWQRLEAGAAIFVVVILLTYLGAYRRA